MPLTPQDVHSKVFGPTRFRRGYDEAEVDAFLDEVEIELTRLHREIDSLRSQLSGTGLGAGAGASAAGHPETGGATDDDIAVDATPVDGATAAPGSTAGAAQAAAQSVAAETGTSGIEQQVARTLVLAQRAADEAVRDAEQEAEQLRLRAQSEAERVRAEAEEQAERERREGEQARSAAEDDVEQLRSFEREYRTRLRAYLELQLRELEGSGAQVESAQRAALPGGVAGDGNPPTVAGSDDALLTTDLPTADPASVPPLAPLSDAPRVPPSVSVDDYAPQSGVTEHGSGEEHFREPRDLHDGH